MCERCGVTALCRAQHKCKDLNPVFPTVDTLNSLQLCNNDFDRKIKVPPSSARVKRRGLGVYGTAFCCHRRRLVHFLILLRRSLYLIGTLRRGLQAP